MTDNANAGRDRTIGRRQLALLTIAALAVIAAVLVLVRPSGPAPRGPTPSPAAVGTASPSPSPSAGPSASSSAGVPPAGEGIVGDYRCLTLVAATAAIERDGFAVGSVAYTIEGGPVADDWLVSDQTPGPGEPLPTGGAIDLVLSSPIVVCPTP